MTHVLDTTAVSAAMRGDEAITEFLKNNRPGSFALVPPVVAEIEYGIRRLEDGSRKRQLLELQKGRFFRVFRVLDWTPDASVRFGSIKANLEHRGQLIDDFDIVIAAIALSHGAGIITSNIAHFSRIEDLVCRGWTVPAE